MTSTAPFIAVLFAFLFFAGTSVPLAGPDAKAAAFAAIDRNADAIAGAGDAICSFAELGMQEVETTRPRAGMLKDMGCRGRSLFSFHVPIRIEVGEHAPLARDHPRSLIPDPRSLIPDRVNHQ
jgi:hypothetical protein